MDRPEQLVLNGARSSGGLFAPTLRFHEGIFYLICTNVTDRGNFVITATDPAGPWSDPHYIDNAEGIDPSLFFDQDGRCWYIGNGNPEVELYEGHHTLWLQEFDYKDFKLIGQKRVVVDGGSDISTEPIWIEAPHLYKIGAWYVILAAEGGTADQHSEVAFRSRVIDGPYESCPHNPIFTNRNLDLNRKNAITCTGHADLVETPNGEWWMVALACRPYGPAQEGRTGLGRETFMLPLHWEDGWPVVDNQRVEHDYTKPDLEWHSWGDENYRQSATEFVDPFSSSRLHPYWNMIRNPDLANPFWELDPASKRLWLECRPETLAEAKTPAFIGIRQRGHHFSASVRLDFEPMKKECFAGLAYRYSDEVYFALVVGKSSAKGMVARLISGTKNGEQLLAELTVDPDGTYPLEISIDKDKVEARVNGTLMANRAFDASAMNSVVSGGFVGCFVGLYATAAGKTSTDQASFSEFSYIGD